MTVTVRKHTWQGVFRYAWTGEVIERDGERLVILAEWRGPGEPRVGEISFVSGDRFLEFYYPGRAYAIWQVEDSAGTIKGWYGNISTPLIEHQQLLSFDDLLLDVIAYPDGRYEVLDRDEFELARQAGLPDERAALAESALAEVIALLHAGEPPFTFAAGIARPIVGG